MRPRKVLIVGNYPPPMCGWAIQTYLVADELRRRGQICQVLKINENRRVRSSAYVDVQSGWDYFSKIVRFILRGYRVNVHVNGTSRKGYLLALTATLLGRLAFRPSTVTFHGGLPQSYFPRHDSRFLHLAFRLLFQSAGQVACDSAEIKQAIEEYRINPAKVSAIATFSPQYLKFERVPLGEGVEKFLSEHSPVIFSYVSFRPEYRLEVVRDAIRRFREKYPSAGCIWLGFPAGEMPAARAFVDAWTENERGSLLLLGNLTHNEFLTLLTRCSVYLRSPACDGVAASVIEALSLKIPVVASANGRRPAGVITYQEQDPADMCAKIELAIEQAPGARPPSISFRLDDETIEEDEGEEEEDNVARMADWLAA